MQFVQVFFNACWGRTIAIVHTNWPGNSALWIVIMKWILKYNQDLYFQVSTSMCKDLSAYVSVLYGCGCMDWLSEHWKYVIWIRSDRNAWMQMQEKFLFNKTTWDWSRFLFNETIWDWLKLRCRWTPAAHYRSLWKLLAWTSVHQLTSRGWK